MFNLNSRQMYEVFFNDCLIDFNHKNDNSFKDNINQLVDIKSVDDFLILISTIEKYKYAEEMVVSCNVHPETINDIRRHLNEIPAAGGVVRNMKQQLLFINRLGRWDLPKGKIEENETLEVAALREVEEECGLTHLQVLKQLPSTFHIYRSPFHKHHHRLVLKETFWFEMLHTGNGEVIPQTSENINEVRWFPENELEEVYASTYNNLKRLLDFYLD